MNNFTVTMPADVPAAVGAVSRPSAAFIAGGTTVVDLWKLGAYPVSQLVDINSLTLRGIDAKATSLKLGALERMSDVGANSAVKANFPVVSQALLLSASPQIRNMGTMGGNLLQRPRSITYRNPNPKLQDSPSRFDAIFGLTPFSRAVHPSDLAVALLALDASVRVVGASGERLIKLSDFYHPPAANLAFTTLGPGELITSIEAELPFAAKSTYVKIRDRASYQFAVVSAAVVLHLEDKVIKDARIAAGGVGTIPWRFPRVEEALKGKPATLDTFRAAVAGLGDGATTHDQNAFKVELLKRTVVRGLNEIVGAA